MTDKELLAQALREYPTWGDAYLAMRADRDRLQAQLDERAMLLVAVSVQRDRYRDALEGMNTHAKQRLIDQGQGLVAYVHAALATPDTPPDA